MASYDHSMFKKALVLATTLTLWFTAAQAADELRVEALVPGMTIQRLAIALTNIESLDDGPGGNPRDIKHPDFPDKPTGTGLLTLFESPVNWNEHFGSRVRGYVHPPQTGDYVFSMATDDYAELWLSTSEDPTKKTRIVSMNRWTPSRVWEKYPEQTSKPIRLEAGRRYYIEALQMEDPVDDCLAVGWQLPDGTLERPIPAHGCRPRTNSNLSRLW